MIKKNQTSFVPFSFVILSDAERISLMFLSFFLNELGSARMRLCLNVCVCGGRAQTRNNF